MHKKNNLFVKFISINNYNIKKQAYRGFNVPISHINYTLAALAFGISMVFSPVLNAQDAEFSQFFSAPMHLNPAMIGFSPAPRINLNFRYQYPSFGNPYTTLAVSYDQAVQKLNGAIGASIYADRAGQGIYNTYLFSGMYAYQLPLTQKVSMKLAIQASYLQNSIDWDKLIFTDQINTSNGNTNLPTAEIIGDKSTIHRFDAGAGAVAYTDNWYLSAGFKHITRPNLDFTNNQDPDNKMGVRTSIAAGKVFYLGQKIRGKSQLYLSPNILFVNQYDFYQAVASMYAGKGIIFGGLAFRHTIKNSDALILAMGIKKGLFKFGYSYDFTISGLKTNAGAHELALQIDFGQDPLLQKKLKEKKQFICPETF